MLFLSAPICYAQQPEVIAVDENHIDKQLKLNRDALFDAAKEQMRIDAAMVLLVDTDKRARAILIDALFQSENEPARAAVCKALVQMRSTEEKVPQKNDFVEPLLSLLKNEKGETALLCAEATLLFDYEQMGQQLVEIVNDEGAGTNARLNALAALKLHPDMRVIFALIEELDDSDIKVAAEAENILKSLGIDVTGKDVKSRRQIITEIKKKGADEFLRDWLLRQDNQIRQLREQIQFWQKRYLDSLDKVYASIEGDGARGDFLSERISDSDSMVRQWAVARVYQGWLGTAIDKSQLLKKVEPGLILLISDPDRDVRFAAANLLSVMGGVNCGEKLLEQLKVEADPDVKLEQFVALGAACHYAFSPNSGIELDMKVKLQTLDIAAKYLNDSSPEKAAKAANVLARLLERDGLEDKQRDEYLALLADKYQQPETALDHELKAGLLNDMARLCAQSVYKEKAASVFGKLFQEATTDENPTVREAAINGLIYIDKAKALGILRKDFVNDSSPAIRLKLIALAAEVGSAEDVSWLSSKIANEGEGQPAWDALMEIFRLSDVSVLEGWLPNLSNNNGNIQFSDSQKRAFLELAEKKLKIADKSELLNKVQSDLADIYLNTDSFKLAAEYYGQLASRPENANRKDELLANLVKAHLLNDNIESAGNVLEFYLQGADIAGDNPIMVTLNDCLTNQVSNVKSRQIVEALSKIKTENNRPNWQNQINKLLPLEPVEKTHQTDPNAS